ncbi:GerAB/ArcD/ProY family transporter [Cohnella panacarvi]|uniref:GerAB/ArcD/ProY family transporter n=1 Tax=Cohnella panacarvi TaxID=400776 RepID=UPI0004788E92|nr:endospore germination permease [Cohnella panacarvi]
MHAREQISSGQMSVVFFCFMTGSSIVNIPGPLIGYAKMGAWISLALALSTGMALLACVMYMHRRYPDLDFIEYSYALVGKWMTALLAIPFVSFLFHMTSGIVLDIGLFMTTTMMRQTPIILFLFFVFLVVALTVRSGIETMARMFFIPIVSVIGSIVAILALSYPNYKPEHLLPLMPDGIKPIALGTYFAYGFPYAELVLIAMLLPYVRKKKQGHLHRGMYLALLVNGLFLIAVTLSTIMVFGPMSEELSYSMFEVARTVDMLVVLQRIESFVGISLITASFMKASISLAALNLAVVKLFNLKDNRILVFPLTLICFLLSLLQIENGQAFWSNSVGAIHPLWATAAFVLPLLIVATVSLFRRTP